MVPTFETFQNFLHENGCIKEFDIEFERQHPGYHMDARLWEILGGDECFFGRAFDWSETAQGREFWKYISDTWYHSCADCNSSN